MASVVKTDYSISTEILIDCAGFAHIKVRLASTKRSKHVRSKKHWHALCNILYFFQLARLLLQFLIMFLSIRCLIINRSTIIFETLILSWKNWYYQFQINVIQIWILCTNYILYLKLFSYDYMSILLKLWLYVYGYGQTYKYYQKWSFYSQRWM